MQHSKDCQYSHNNGTTCGYIMELFHGTNRIPQKFCRNCTNYKPVVKETEMNKLKYLLDQGAQLVSDKEIDEILSDGSQNILTSKGDYIGLYSKTNDKVLASDIIFKHKLVNLQSADEGSGRSVVIGFSEKEQAWYGWTHRGFGSFKIGYTPDDTCWIVTEGYVKPGYVAKTLEDCKQCAKYMSDYLD